MAAKSKEVYQTLKRSISATTSGLPNLLKFGNHTSLKDSSNRWIHPPEALIKGRVDYGCKMLGHTEVAESKGAHVVRDAIHAIRFQLTVNRSLASSEECKPKKVEVQINVNGVTVVDSKTKLILHRHPLHSISFCADDKQDPRVFSYIAKNDENKHICYLFLSDKLAEQITLTIGEAFDLAFQQYIEKKSKAVLNTDDVGKLKERIGELEADNRALRIELEFLKKKYSIPDGSHPALPDTPVPKLPPPGYRANDSVVQLPPPSSSSNKSRQNNSLLTGLDMSGPGVGTKLENLHIDKMDNVFDDSFDPRAHEKKEAQAQASSSSPTNGTGDATYLEAMIAQCDSKITRMQGFQHATLEFGNIADLKSIPTDDEYIVPTKSSTALGNGK